MTKLTPQELDKRLEFYIGKNPDLEKMLKQLIRDCIEAVTQKLHGNPISVPDHDDIDHPFILGRKHAIDTIESNTKELLG